MSDSIVLQPFTGIILRKSIVCQSGNEAQMKKIRGGEIIWININKTHFSKSYKTANWLGIPSFLILPILYLLFLFFFSIYLYFFFFFFFPPSSSAYSFTTAKDTGRHSSDLLGRLSIPSLDLSQILGHLTSNSSANSNMIAVVLTRFVTEIL